MTAWKQLLADAPMAIVTEHWPVLRTLSGYNGSYQEREPTMVSEPTKSEVVEDLGDVRPIASCAVCGEAFRMNSTTQVTCGHRCGATYRGARRRERNLAKIEEHRCDVGNGWPEPKP